MTLKVGKTVKYHVGLDLTIEGEIVGILKAGQDIAGLLKGVPPERVRIRENVAVDDRYVVRTAHGFYYACRCSLVDRQMQVLR